MSWENKIEAADKYDVNSSMDARTGTRGGTRDSFQHPSIGGYGGYGGKINVNQGGRYLSSYSVVGINATGAKQSADNLVSSANAVMNKIDSIQVDTSILQGAVKGEEMENAIRSYIDTVKLYCQAVISDIKSFADKLYEVSDVWHQSQATFATDSVEASKNTSFSNGATDFYSTKEASDAGATGGAKK